MLLAFDVGNTTIAIGLFRGRKLVKSWKIETDSDKTSDEYGVLLLSLMQAAGLAAGKITGAIISSVVPHLTPAIEDVCQSTFGTTASVVGPGLKTGMPILYENPLEVGADRITASVAAFEKYGGPLIVLDFGTATTQRLARGRVPAVEGLWAALCGTLERWYNVLTRGNKEAVIEAFTSRSAFSRGDTVRVETADEVFEAGYQGLDPEGRLVVTRDAAGMVVLDAVLRLERTR